MATKIFEEGQPAIDRWFSVLSAGGTLTPDGLLKLAGLDMSTPEQIEATVKYVGSLVDALVTLFQ